MMLSGPRGWCPAGRSLLPGAGRRAGRPRSNEALLGRELRGGRGADRDLARLGLLADRDADLEHAVVVAGLDRVGVEVVRQADAAGGAGKKPLAGRPGLRPRPL